MIHLPSSSTFAVLAKFFWSYIDSFNWLQPIRMCYKNRMFIGKNVSVNIKWTCVGLARLSHKGLWSAKKKHEHLFGTH